MRAADQVEFLARVVDERAQVGLLAGVELVGKEVRHMLADGARAVVEDMDESLVLSVQVAHKVLRGRRQVADGLEVDDLGKDGLCRRELAREQLEVFEPVGVHMRLPSEVFGIIMSSIIGRR